ncbi:hypothetical protein E4U23_006137 [Claviceps purpurea]|nr:hypothetical protein E4U23_006137 [Claviceps purpurea]
MGNRENRSTEVALSTLTEVVRAYGGIASLLQLDITAAFDSVDQRIHYRETGLPPLRKPNDRSNTAGVSHILSRRLYTVIIKSFPVRLSDKQDTTEITKRMSASNGLTELVASVTLPRVHRGIVRFGVEYLRLGHRQNHHTHGKPGKAARGVAKALTKEQTKCLRVVTGACKATPGTIVETESAVPLVDLFLDYIKRRFQVCVAVANHLRRRQRRPPFTPFQDRPAPDPDGLTPDKIVEKEWKDGGTETEQNPGRNALNSPSQPLMNKPRASTPRARSFASTNR